MPRSLVYVIYNLLLPVALLLGFPSFIIKGIKRGGLARNFRQRFGFFSAETLASVREKDAIWIHAVSVGEMFLAFKIVEALREKAPNQHLIVSTTTTTGFTLAAEKASESITVIHNPVDLPFVTSRVIRLLSPSQLVLVEAEVWPNLVRQLRKREIPVSLVNARLSPRSEARYRKVASVIEPVFSQLTGATVPYPVDVKRWASLGIPEDSIEITGSVKFDNPTTLNSSSQQVDELRQWLVDTGMKTDARILIGGSTHAGEEVLLANEFRQIKSRIPDLELVIIPRHAERGGEIKKALKEEGFSPILRGPGGGKTEGSAPEKEPIWIANTTGELNSWYQLAEAVVVGKSFCSIGGQNPVESVVAGKPTIVGPHMENFSDVMGDLLSAGGILQLGCESELADALIRIFEDPESGIKMAKQGKDAMARHIGATAKNAAFILSRKSAGGGESNTE